MGHLKSGVSGGKFRGLSRQHSVSSKPLDSNLEENNTQRAPPQYQQYKSEFNFRENDQFGVSLDPMEKKVDMTH